MALLVLWTIGSSYEVAGCRTEFGTTTGEITSRLVKPLLRSAR